MDFDTYWNDLIDRIYNQKIKLQGAEADLYRLTCIYGETMVDGVEAYFERRYEEYDTDMKLLSRFGFNSIASDFHQVKTIMFGDEEMTKEVVIPVVDRLLEEYENDKHILEKINEIYDRLIDSLPSILKVRDQIGVDNNFYEENA